jgi:hypothetical protein
VLVGPLTAREIWARRRGCASSDDIRYDGNRWGTMWVPSSYLSTSFRTSPIGLTKKFKEQISPTYEGGLSVNICSTLLSFSIENSNLCCG